MAIAFNKILPTKNEWIALLIPLIALLLHTLAWPFVKPHVWFAFYTSLYFSARVGGERGGIYATFFTAILVYFFELQPLLSLVKNNLGDYVSMLFFILVGVAFSKMQGKLDRQLVDLKLSSVVFDSKQGMAITDANRNIIRTNETYANISGYSVDELLGQNPKILRSGTHSANFYQDMWQAINSKGVWEGEVYNRRKNGEVYPASLVITKIFDKEGNVSNYVSVMTDISEKKLQEEKLRDAYDELEALNTEIEAQNQHLLMFNEEINESKAYLEAIIQNEPECIKVVDVDGRLIQMNPAGLRMIEADSFEEVNGKPVLDLIAPDCKASFADMHQKVIDGEPGHLEFQVLGLKGGLRWLETSAVAMGSKGKTVHLAVTRDITERRQLEENLRLINKHLQELVKHETEQRVAQEKLLIQQSKMAMMGEMIGAIAHQWRQPLNSLGLTIQDVPFAYEYGEINKEYIEKFKNDAMNNINTMSRTIEDFRNFFSPNKKAEQFFLEDAINESLKILDSQLRVHGVQIIFDIDSSHKHPYLCYKNELKQVLLNILANAKDALLEKKPQNPFIKIVIGQNGSVLTLSIEDSAGGIPEEIIGKIFDAHFTTKEEGKGTGIGLYMSKQIVDESLHGKLTAVNTENGAKFTIELA